MNIENKIGSFFFRVEYCGVVTKCIIDGYKNGNPVYNLIGLTNLKDYTYRIDEFKIKDDHFKSTSNYPIQTVLDNKEGQYFDNFKDAKKNSLERFEKEVNPNGDYRVARYFDDHFEAYVTGVLSKKDASITQSVLVPNLFELPNVKIKSVPTLL